MSEILQHVLAIEFFALGQEIQSNLPDMSRVIFLSHSKLILKPETVDSMLSTRITNTLPGTVDMVNEVELSTTVVMAWLLQI